MKIKEMSKEQLREYHNQKTKEWRIKNPEKNHEARKQYKNSEKGKEANRKYQRKRSVSPEGKEYLRNYFKEYRRKYPKKFKQKKGYINQYMKRYLVDEENHNKYLQRQKDYHTFRESLLEIYDGCQRCGSKENLEIHHLTYLSPKFKDLIILCRNCHRQLHRKENNTGGKTKW